MSRIFVCGFGAVSPAGWGMTAFREALRKGEPLPGQPLERPGWQRALKACPVPSPVSRPGFLGHPRLRRTSPITHYAAAAALEAAANSGTRNGLGRRLGMVVCQHVGCVQYTQRFFSEVLKDPATASPLVFPETVFAAPASHVAALLEDSPMLYTLIGDPAAFLSGLWLGVGWLLAGLVDVCLIVGTEEANWVLAEALWLFEHSTTISSGAGAVCLCTDATLSLGVELNLITQAHTFSQPKDRARAAQAMRDQFPPSGVNELLCDGCGASYRTNAAERSAWRDWTGPRLSPKRILGEGLMAAAAWQCVAACDAVASGEFNAANVSLVGCNQQAIGARFIRVRAGESPHAPEQPVVEPNHGPDRVAPDKAFVEHGTDK